MDNGLLPIIGAFATLGAAFIAAVIALGNMLNSKDQKTTEFRQAWINSLRLEIAMFASQARFIGAAVAHAKRFDPNCFSRDSKAYEVYAEHRERIANAYYAICLYFKPDDTEFKRLKELMDKALSELGRPSSLLFSEVEEILQEITEFSRVLLKKEWERVKSGELTYRITKYAAMVIIAVSIGGGGVFAYRFAVHYVFAETDKIRTIQPIEKDSGSSVPKPPLAVPPRKQ